MRLIPLSQGREAQVDNEDYTWLSHYKWHWHDDGTLLGKAICGQRLNGVRRCIQMHRLIWEHHNGPIPPGIQIDHIDGNGVNNHLTNLRLATYGQNQANRRKQQGTSKYKGVFWYSRYGKWCVQLGSNTKKINLGYFTSELDAARAYDRAALQHFGQFARLNFPPDVR